MFIYEDVMNTDRRINGAADCLANKRTLENIRSGGGAIFTYLLFG